MKSKIVSSEISILTGERRIHLLLGVVLIIEFYNAVRNKSKETCIKWISSIFSYADYKIQLPSYETVAWPVFETNWVLF